MNIHTLLLTDTPLVERVGLTLAHTVWQGLAAAALLRLALGWARSPRLRYALACLALLAVAGAGGVTFARLGGAPAIAAIKTPMATVVPPLSAPVVAQSVPLAEQPFNGRLATTGIVYLWGIGVAAQAILHLLGWTRIRRLGREPDLVDARWLTAFAVVTNRLDVRRAVRLLGSTHADVPVVLGVLQPAIVVPLSLLTTLPVEHVEALLAHELAHVRRHDYLANLIQCCVEAVFFYHPAVWWISAQIRREREHCCDDAAADVSGDRQMVASALVALEHRRGPRVALAATGSSLVGRVRRLTVDIPTRHRSSGLCLGVVTTSVAAILSAAYFGGPSTSFAQPLPSSRPFASTVASDHLEDPELQRRRAEKTTVERTIEQLQDTAKLAVHPSSEFLAATRAKIARNEQIRLNIEADIADRLKTLRAIDAADRLKWMDVVAHVTVGRDGFIAVDGGAGDWVTVRDRLAKLPTARRAGAVVELVAESDDVPVGELFRAETEGERALAEVGGGRLNVATIAAGPAPSWMTASGEVYVGGDVQRPGVYSTSKRRITVKQQIVSAGGWQANRPVWITLYRRSEGGRTILENVPLADILSGAAPDTYLSANDVLIVSSADPAKRSAPAAAVDPELSKLIQSDLEYSNALAGMDPHDRNSDADRKRLVDMKERNGIALKNRRRALEAGAATRP